MYASSSPPALVSSAIYRGLLPSARCLSRQLIEDTHDVSTAEEVATAYGNDLRALSGVSRLNFSPSAASTIQTVSSGGARTARDREIIR